MARLTSWQPSTAQTLLLQACLSPEPLAAAALARWRTLDPALRADGASQRLLPLLYGRWGQEGAGAHRRSWAHHKLLQACSYDLFASLSQAAVPLLVIKGFPLAHTVYPEPAQRPLADIDFVVPWSRSDEAVSHLRRHGWEPLPTPLKGDSGDSAPAWQRQPRSSLDAAYRRVRHSHGFRHPRHGLSLDLHWAVFQGHCEPGRDDALWQRSRPLPQASHRSMLQLPSGLRVLDPADHLLLVLAHGARWQGPAPIRWVADAVNLIRGEPAVDWDRFFAVACSRELSLVAARLLAWLQASQLLELPAQVLAKLEAQPIAWRERLLYAIETEPPGWRSGFSELLYIGGCRRALKRENPACEAPASYSAFLCHVLGAPSQRALAAHLGRELWRRRRST
ncbi:nucleotidyltransferase family protein [Synechococcus sp. ATX 2A4]|nr:nucleotidyltransferase family protein [Synechococcus sp. ATX 2A4]